MYPFVETIQIIDGKVCRLSYHNERMNATRTHFYSAVSPININNYLIPRTEKGVLKCRVVYTDCIHEVSYSPYTMRQIKSLRMVCDDNIDYEFKSTDRRKLNELSAMRGNEDEVLIIRNGFITDTSFTNIALFDGKDWITPAHPLLKGTQRAFLIKQGILQELDVAAKNIRKYKELCMFNSMIDFGKFIIPINRIV